MCYDRSYDVTLYCHSGKYLLPLHVVSGTWTAAATDTTAADCWHSLLPLLPDSQAIAAGTATSAAAAATLCFPTLLLHPLLPLLPHRPDVASHLTHRLVQRLFNNRTDTEAAAAVTAGLLLLPQGWEEACADPHQYVNSFVAAVLQVCDHIVILIQQSVTSSQNFY